MEIAKVIVTPVAGKSPGWFTIIEVDTGVYHAVPRNKLHKFDAPDWVEFYFSKVNDKWQTDPVGYLDELYEILDSLKSVDIVL